MTKTRFARTRHESQTVVFGLFTILALTFNLVFVMGEIEKSMHHDMWVLTIAILVNLIAMC